jgi:hypothetical protein
MAATLSLSQCQALFQLIDGASSTDAIITALNTAAKLVENAGDPSKSVLKQSNAGLQKRLLSLSHAEEVLVALGFVADAEAGTLTWDASLDASAPAVRAAAVREALHNFEAIVSAIVHVGDTNAPAAAQDALKLVGLYVGNIATEPDNEARRRLGAAHKAV